MVLPVVDPKGLKRSDRLHAYNLLPASPYYVLRDRTSKVVIHYNVINLSRGPHNTVLNLPVPIVQGSRSANSYIEGDLQLGPRDEILIVNS